MRKSMIVLTVVLLVIPLAPHAEAARLPLLGKSIVIDAGHGGVDPGAVGHGVTEEELVLQLALQLQSVLVSAGAEVKLTRDADNDLSHLISPQEVPSRKRRDIMGRVQLVNDWQPDVLLSLHANAISSSRWRGAQVFYQQHSQRSAALAEHLQASLRQVLQNTHRQPQAGDYRLLNDSQPLAVLLEVGFISNPEEAALLAQPAYREQLSLAILQGLLNWWASGDGAAQGTVNAYANFFPWKGVHAVGVEVVRKAVFAM
ncbi:MAG: N-acetylmuramoyl-L-alanine amidase [Bacillota bacterium]